MLTSYRVYFDYFNPIMQFLLRLLKGPMLFCSWTAWNLLPSSSVGKFIYVIVLFIWVSTYSNCYDVLLILHNSIVTLVCCCHYLFIIFKFTSKMESENILKQKFDNWVDFPILCQHICMKRIYFNYILFHFEMVGIQWRIWWRKYLCTASELYRVIILIFFSFSSTHYETCLLYLYSQCG